MATPAREAGKCHPAEPPCANEEEEDGVLEDTQPICNTALALKGDWVLDKLASRFCVIEGLK